MSHKFALIVLFFIHYSQQATKIYLPLPIATPLFNPERGLYKHTETFSNDYDPLDLFTLQGYKSKNYSIILRVFYLNNFVNSDISSVYLNNIQNDFNIIRQSGLKAIVRFAYSNSDTASMLDATKIQMLRHLTQLKALLTQNVDVIYVVQAGLIGAWGEWYYTSNFGYPTISSSNLQNRKDIVLALLSVIPPSRMIQLRTPSYKQRIFTHLPLNINEAFKQQPNASRVGHHNDCFLASDDDYGTYENKAQDYAYLSQDTLYSPMGGETCVLNAPRSSCQTAQSELALFHWSYLNIDYNEQVINSWRTGGCFISIQHRLGYRFELVSATLPDTINLKDGIFSISLVVKNTGYAALFNERKVYLILRNTRTLQEFSIVLRSDPRLWLAGTAVSINETHYLPSGISADTYSLFLNLPDSSSTLANRVDYSIRFANQYLWDNNRGLNNLQHTFTVTSV